MAQVRGKKQVAEASSETGKNGSLSTAVKNSARSDMSATDLAELAADAGAGLENVTLADMQVPFLTILQSNSPQVVKRGAEYVEGAEPGLIFNTVTQSIYEQVTFIPCYYQRRYTEWRPRESGGGLVRDWGSDDGRLRASHRDEKTGRDTTPDGNNIVTSATFFGILHPTGERVVLALSSTQLKKGRQWLTLHNAVSLPHPQTGVKFTPPLFYSAYALRGDVPESNEKGDWFGWKITRLDSTKSLDDGASFYQEARRLQQDVHQQKVQIAAQAVAAIGQQAQGDEIPY